MSQWTHVTGCLYIETFKEEKDIKKYVEKLLETTPKITGSEKDCDIFVNPLSGYNTSTNCDCKNCEYGKTKVYLDEGGFQCNANESYECPRGEYQTCVAITIIGDLRDRDGNTTRKEIERFIRSLQHLDLGFFIDYCSIRVRDDWDGDYDLIVKYDDEDWEDKGTFIWKKVDLDV